MKYCKFLFLLLMVGFIFISDTYAFYDVSEDHWAYNTIMLMSSKGIVSGFEDGSFKPDDVVTREQFAAVLVNTLKLKRRWNSAKLNFKDVEQDRWSEKYIDAISDKLDSIELDGELYFNPTEPITREDVAYAIGKAMYLGDDDSLNKFLDADEISRNKRWEVGGVVENNIMSGNADGTFNPLGKLTRAELVSVIRNILPEIKSIGSLELKNGENVKVFITDDGKEEKAEVFSADGKLLDSIGGIDYIWEKRVVMRVDDFNNDGNPDFVLPGFSRKDHPISEIYTILDNGKLALLFRSESDDLFLLKKIGEKIYMTYDSEKWNFFSYDNNGRFYELGSSFFDEIKEKIDAKSFSDSEYKVCGILKPSEIIDNDVSDYEEEEGDAVYVGTLSTYSATSTFDKEVKNYSVNNLRDYDKNNCWVEGVEGDGIGEILEISAIGECEKLRSSWVDEDVHLYDLAQVGSETICFLFSEFNMYDDIGLEEITDYYQALCSISIVNGYAQNEELWKNNNRVKKMKLIIDGKEEYILELEDTDKEQIFKLDYKNSNIGRPINTTFEILDVYKGDKYDDTAITMLKLGVGSNVKWGGR